MMILIYLIGLLSLFYYFLTKNNSYWQSKGVPFDKPFLFFGSMYKSFTGKEHISETFRRIYKEHTSPYVGIYLFNSPGLMIRSPELVKKVLVKDFDKFTNRSGTTDEKIDPVAYHSLGFTRDKVWKNLRSKISPVFTSGKLKLMYPLMKECGENLEAYLEKRNGQIVVMEDAVKRYSVDIISSCAFGINSNSLKIEDAEIFKASKKILDSKSFVRNFSLFCIFFMPKLVHLLKLTFTDPASTKYLIDVFKNNLREREKLKIERHDLIDLLNNMKKQETSDDSYKFDDIKMAAQAIVFFSAGNDTTAITLTFAFYELALHKDIQQRLREEIRESFKENGGFTYESIQNLKYLDMVLNETLRKYPLTTFHAREASTDYVFEESGLKIEKGTNVFIPTSGLHFDEEYFPNPEKFDPERFSDENKGNIVPYTFTPFGDGPRICIGQRFAQINSKIALCYMLKNFAFELPENADIPVKLEKASLFLKAENGVPVKVTKL